jgi:hypothetical protein
LKDAIATLMDDGAMNPHPIASISFFGYSPQSPPQPDDKDREKLKCTTNKRFMLKKTASTGVCDMGLDERDRPLPVCYANSHNKLPKAAKGVFQSKVPGTVVSFQFQPMSLMDSKRQLGLIMEALKTHALFDSTAAGLDVNVVVPKGMQPSTVFTRCEQDPHSKVFIYPGLLLSTPETPDSAKLSCFPSTIWARDSVRVVNAALIGHRYNDPSYAQLHQPPCRRFTRKPKCAFFYFVVSLHGMYSHCTVGLMSSRVFKPLLTAFFASQPTKYRDFRVFSLLLRQGDD